MGHYEESYAEEDRKIAAMRKARLERIRKFIVNDIRKRSIGEVLADIVNDPTSYQQSAGREL